MANLEISVELRGEVKALEALAGVSKHAAFAQKTALRAAGRNGRSGIARTLAAKYNVKLKTFKNRVRFFNQRGKRRDDPVAQSRLWYGMNTGIKSSLSATTTSLTKAQNPKGFAPKLQSGHKGWYYRKLEPRLVGKGARERPRERHALPIKEYRLDLSPGAVQLVERHARRVMRTVYVDTFRKDYKRRIDKIRKK